MQVHFGVETLHPEWTEAVACIGTFDGVHLGHESVISQAVSRAKASEVPCALITFDRNPLSLLAPARAPKPIATLSANLARFKELGVSVAIVLPFDALLSRMSAEQFFSEIVLKKAKASLVVVGHDFAMGNAREGDTDWLRTRIETHVVPPFAIEGQRVSSSLIREAISQGKIQTANRLLGRSFTISGMVVGGQKLGRTLNFPTINVARSTDQVMPLDGVYAAKCHNAFGEFMAALAIGMRPAVQGKQRTIEAFLLDYPGDSLYGRNVHLHIEELLRPEANFPSLDALVTQMGKDVAAVRTYFTNSNQPTLGTV